MGHGLKTFMTFTVRAEERDAFQSGDFILGREMRRVLKAINEWYKRRGEPLLLYIWVAENPRNDNPHVHLLTNHAVPKAVFQDFAAHVESLWGHGWVHIERIRSSDDAGRYLMKAVKYSLKGSNQAERLWGEADVGQGAIIGNRYGITRAILPKYETVELYDCVEEARELRNMQALLKSRIEEYAPGIWLTEYGLAFEAGSDIERLSEVVHGLNECRSRAGDT